MPTGLDEAVRLAVYQGFANDAHPPTIDGLATTLDTDASSIHESLSRLSEARHVVLDAHGPGLGRRRPHLQQPAPLLYPRVRGALGGTCGSAAWLCHGPGHALAPR